MTRRTVLAATASCLVLLTTVVLWSRRPRPQAVADGLQAPSSPEWRPGAAIAPGLVPPAAGASESRVAGEVETPEGRRQLAREHADEDRGGSSLLARVPPGVVPIALPRGSLLDSGQQEVAQFVNGSETALGDLEPGSYRLVSPGPGWRLEPSSFDKVAGVPLRLEARFEPTNLYSGRVYDAATASPIPDFDVHLSSEDLAIVPPLLVNRSLEVPPDPDGKFRLGGAQIARGRIQLVFSAEGYQPARTPWMDAQEGAVHGHLVVELEPDDGPTAWLDGRVVDAEQRPLSGVDVSAYRLDGGQIDSVIELGARLQPRWSISPATLDSDELRTSATTDERGELTLGLEPDEPYQVIAWKSGYSPSLSGSFSCTTGERRPLEIVLRAGARLSGRVLGDENTPAATTVGLFGPTPQMVTVAGDGTFEAVGLADGSYKATVLAADMLPIQAESFEISGGRDLELTIRCGALREGATLRGRVVLPEGVEGFQFRICAVLDRASELVAGMTGIGADGTFELHGLPDEPEAPVFVALIGAKRMSSLSGSLVRVVGRALVEDPSVDLVLDAAATLLRITYEGPRAPQGEEPSCYLMSPTGDPRLRVMLPDVTRMFLAPERELAIHGLPPGEYTLEGLDEPIDVAITTGRATHVSVPPQ